MKTLDTDAAAISMVQQSYYVIRDMYYFWACLPASGIWNLCSEFSVLHDVP